MTRRRLLLEMEAAGGRLLQLASQGDRRRFEDDDGYRCGIAFLWLRLGEPASRLLSGRLVESQTLPAWSRLPLLRNSLAHDWDDDIDYNELWDSIPTMAVSIGIDVRALLAA